MKTGDICPECNYEFPQPMESCPVCNQQPLSPGAIANITGEYFEGVSEPGKIKELIEDMYDRLIKKKGFDSFQLSYLQSAFKKIIDGEDPTKAMGLKHKRGRPKKNTERDQIIAYAVYLSMKDGNTLEEAASELEEIYHTTKIADIYSELKKTEQENWKLLDKI